MKVGISAWIHSFLSPIELIYYIEHNKNLEEQLYIVIFDST